MTDPATIGCLVGFFGRLCCKGGADEDEEQDVTLPSVSVQNSCNRWFCCFGTNCCNSTTTTVVGNQHFGNPQVALREKRTGSVFSKRMATELVLEAVGEGDGQESPTTDRAQESNQILMNAFIEKKKLPKVCILAAARSLAGINQKLVTWDENSTQVLNADDIKQMNDATRSEKNYYKVARQILQKLQAQEALSLKGKQSSHSTSSNLPRDRHRRWFFKKTKVVSEDGDSVRFNTKALADDITRLFKVDFDAAYEIAYEIKRPFKRTKVTRDAIWEALVEKAFVMKLELREDDICHDSKLEQLTEIAKSVKKVADMTLKQYSLFRIAKIPSALNTPVDSLSKRSSRSSLSEEDARGQAKSNTTQTSTAHQLQLTGNDDAVII